MNEEKKNTFHFFGWTSIRWTVHYYRVYLKRCTYLNRQQRPSLSNTKLRSEIILVLVHFIEIGTFRGISVQIIQCLRFLVRFPVQGIRFGLLGLQRHLLRVFLE